MPLHPQAQRMIDTLAAGSALDYATLSAAEFRAAFAVPAPRPNADASVQVENLTIAGAAGPISVRLYRPPNDRPLPMTLYLHGGGFVIGSPATTDGICRTLALGATTMIVSPDYRLAPEAPFPAGLEDACATLHWMFEHAGQLGGSRDRIAVAGDSSGGNFAAVLAQLSRREGPRLCHQLLLYPVLDCAFSTPSYEAYCSGYFLTAQMMRWYWRQYLGDERAAADWRVSPLRQTNLAAVPSATIFTAEYDVLRDEAETYAANLIRAGVAVEVKRWGGQIHGFLLQQGIIDDADCALADATASLRRAFG